MNNNASASASEAAEASEAAASEAEEEEEEAEEEEAASEAEAAEEDEDYDWINKYKETEKEYNIFYKSKVLSIEVNSIFINKNNEIIKKRKRRVNYEKGKKIIDFYPPSIKKKYKLISAFKYNNIIEEEDVLNDDNDEVNLTPINLEEEIIFEKTIEFFQDLNALYMIFIEQQQKKMIGTKEIGTKEIGTKKHKNNNKNKNTRKVINDHIK